MVASIIYYVLLSFLCCVIAGVSADHYAQKHDVDLEDILPLWPCIFISCSAIAFARFVELLIEYM